MHKALTLLLMVFGLLFAALIARSGDLVWMALPFVVYLGMGILRAPLAAEIRLAAERSVTRTRDEAVASIEVGVAVRSQGQAAVLISLADPLLPGMRVTSGELRHSTVLEPGAETALKYAFQSERGTFTWKAVRAAATGSFGLFETALELPAAAEIQARPELKRVRSFAIRPQRTVHSAGPIPARLAGSGTDFWGVREYHPGDPLRRLDWRLAARHPHKYFTREFEQEEIADIGLILDARRKSNPHEGAGSLFEHSARAAASLAEVFLRQGNRVSLLVYGEPIASVYPGYGKVQLNRILSTLARVIPMDAGSLNSLQFIPLRMFSSRSLILVFSPLARDDWRLFPRLRAFGYQVVLISPDPIDYVRPALPVDRDTALAARLAGLERRVEIEKIRQLWIPVIDWQVDRPLDPLVRRALAGAHIRRER